MITGNADGRLTIGIQVSDGGRPYRYLAAAIATDAHFELALPSTVITDLGLAHIDEAEFILGGVEYKSMSYIGYLEWHRGLTPAIVVVAPADEPLIGLGLLRGSFLRADFMAGGEVALYSIR